jgi:hypothetical protein
MLLHIELVVRYEAHNPWQYHHKGIPEQVARARLLIGTFFRAAACFWKKLTP